jgi:putative acetyltransferase
MKIRDEEQRDIADVAELVERAFGRADEARLVEQLRKDGDAVIALVATDEEKVVGHILLSPMSAPFPALGLAPLSVLPDHQKQGIGAALIRTAIERTKEQGWYAIFVLGDPAYYGRFGFRADLAADFSSPYAGPYLMVLPLTDALPAKVGRIDYAPAFDGLA